MPLTILLVFQVFSLIFTPSKAVVYYVTPTEPPNHDCPGQPCQTLDHYFSNKEEYFNRNKVNVTMHLLSGEHILSRNHSESKDTDNCLYSGGPAQIIKDLEMFEMIGLESAHNVVVQLLAEILLMNITKSHFSSVTLFDASNQGSAIYLVGCVQTNNTVTSQISEKTAPVNNINHTFVTVINGTTFNGVMLSQSTSKWPVNFSTKVVNSRFDNLTTFYGISYSIEYLQNYAQKLILSNCTFSNSYLELHYISANVMIFNSIIREGKMTFLKCNVEINGTVLFTPYGLNPFLATYMFSSSCVKITGDVTFANSLSTRIAAYSSTITLSGNISFLNNTGVNGGAMALYSSILKIAPNTTVLFYNNTATETGGFIYVDTGTESEFPPSLPCFYQLPDYDVNCPKCYNITFYNNSASKGGNHIYGASMHSGDCYVALISERLPPVISSCCVQKYFHYDPKSQSSVSSDPIRVCICKSGIKQCNEIIHDIEVYPGETFTLSVVVVGADLGNTVGSVYAIFKNPATTVKLKPPTQYTQGINDINNGSRVHICSELSYTIFSNRNISTYNKTRVMDYSRAIK